VGASEKKLHGGYKVRGYLIPLYTQSNCNLVLKVPNSGVGLSQSSATARFFRALFLEFGGGFKHCHVTACKNLYTQSRVTKNTKKQEKVGNGRRRVLRLGLHLLFVLDALGEIVATTGAF
jgi:hypothetical protein